MEAGYQPEIAYFECLHELKLIVDLMYEGGHAATCATRISDTAEYGDYTAGPRIITEETKKEMQRILDEIQDGRYARRWVAENEAGRPKFNATRAAERSQKLEEVGARLRSMMPFLDAVEVTAEGEVKRAADKPGRRTMTARITIFDTTLRDGEQSPGCSMHTEEKVRDCPPARAAWRGRHRGGFPDRLPGDFEAVRAISEAVRGAKSWPCAGPRRRTSKPPARRSRAPSSPSSTPSSPPPTST